MQPHSSARRLRTVLALSLALLVAPSGLAQIAYDGTILDRANRWDGYPAHLFYGGKHHVWWCSQGSNFQDAIYYAHKSGALGPGGWSSPVQVLAHAQVPWATNHTCDPSVIRGTFSYNGQSYSHALYFTADNAGGTDNSVGVAFSNNGTSWISYPTAVVPYTGPVGLYGAGMSGVARNPATGKIVHAYLDTTYNPILRLNETSNGVCFTPSPPWTTQLHAAGRLGNDGQGPDIAYNPSDGHWYAAIKNHDPQGVYDGETRVLRATNPNDLLGSWQVIGVFNSSVTGFPQNHNSGLGKLQDGQLYVDSQGWAYVFLSVGQVRPNVGTWRVAQGRFRPYLRLSVGKVGDGTGTISASLGGISCGVDCYHDYPAGSSVNLTATPGTYSTFVGWTGDPDCLDGQVTLTASRTCHAEFASTVDASVIWIQPQPSAGFGPPGSLIVAGSATGGAPTAGVQMFWRNVSASGNWNVESYQPIPGAGGIWYHSIPNASYFDLYDVYVVYNGTTSSTCRYNGGNTITWCP